MSTPPSYEAEKLKEKGNLCFKNGEYEEAEMLYGHAIQKNSNSPILYTNRANARLKLGKYNAVIDDCIRSIEVSKDNLKAYYFLAQAQFELHHPNEALTSAITAYNLCASSHTATSNAFSIATYVLKCKKAKWDLRERDRLRRRNELLKELETKLEQDCNNDFLDIEERQRNGEFGEIGAKEEKDTVKQNFEAKITELRNVFAIADPSHMALREVPDYLIDTISFEIMHDPVITKTGQSYERATIVEHLKRNPTDPLSRTPLQIVELRTNVALKKACDDFWEQNNGWAYDW